MFLRCVSGLFLVGVCCVLAAQRTVGLSSSAANPAVPVCSPWQFGAKGDGKTLDTVPIQKAIDACAAKGGGAVVLGDAPLFVSGPLELKSHIILEIKAGTTLAGSENHEDYPEVAEFGQPGRRSLLHAQGAEDIKIYGGGVIDGRGQSWWPNRARITRGRGWWFSTTAGMCLWRTSPCRTRRCGRSCRTTPRT